MWGRKEIGCFLYWHLYFVQIVKNSIFLKIPFYLNFRAKHNISFQFRIFMENPNITSLKISVNRRNDVKFEFLFPENRDEILLTDFQSQCRQQGTNNMIKPLPNYPTGWSLEVSKTCYSRSGNKIHFNWKWILIWVPKATNLFKETDTLWQKVFFPKKIQISILMKNSYKQLHCIKLENWPCWTKTFALSQCDERQCPLYFSEWSFISKDFSVIIFHW